MGRSGAKTRDGDGSRTANGPWNSRRWFDGSKARSCASDAALDDRPVLNVASRPAGAGPRDRRTAVVSVFLAPTIARQANVVRAALDRFGSGTIAHDR